MSDDDVDLAGILSDSDDVSSEEGQAAVTTKPLPPPEKRAPSVCEKNGSRIGTEKKDKLKDPGWFP
jgi:hypothetical protein